MDIDSWPYPPLFSGCGLCLSDAAQLLQKFPGFCSSTEEPLACIFDICRIRI